VTDSAAYAATGPIGLWHLDEGTGTIASDSSGNGNDGTVFGGAQWVPGHFGSALSFNGNAAGVRVLNSPLLEPSTAVSVSAWVMHAGSPGSYRYILAKGATGCISASYALFTGANGGLAFYVSNGHGNTYVISPDAGTGVWDGNWHLIVGTFDGSNVRLFVDGNQVGSGTPHAPPIGYVLTDSNDLYIGDYPSAAPSSECQAHSFLGSIDETTVWDRALTAAEVSAMLHQPTVPPPATSGQPPTGGAGAGTGTGTGTGAGSTPAGQPAAPGRHATPPSLRRLRVSPSAVSAASTARRRAGTTRRMSATISYTDSQVARTTLTVVLAQPGVAHNGRCVRPTQGNRRHARRCTRYLTLGKFAHTDRVGANRFEFAGLSRPLAPHRYRLDAVPSAHGVTGATISTTFTILR